MHIFSVMLLSKQSSHYSSGGTVVYLYVVARLHYVWVLKNWLI